MKKLGYIYIAVFLFGAAFGTTGCKNRKAETNNENAYAGSESCRECHEKFYTLWESSHHGRAMQPIDKAFIENIVTPLEGAIAVGDCNYSVSFENDSIIFYEHSIKAPSTPVKRLPVVWALGGKNVVFLLTPWDGGRFQTLPLAYDVNRKEWYNNPQASVRHFTDNSIVDEAIDWRHSLFTFNTTCHSCHVSQLEKNYDPKTDTYHTIWNEPGINCETCHGPSAEHNRKAREYKAKGKVLPLKDAGLIVTRYFTSDQQNWNCAPCHAKMTPITEAYPPGEPFYDHFNLVTLDNPDFYPDGRDLGENYTYTSWSMNKCLPSGMHCLTCHTSSGRYRFKGEQANNACMPCHKENVTNFEKHTHHKPNRGIECVSCHMPKTEFARMIRSDHSNRPPMPAATIAFGSPNACNICHKDKTPQWANAQVKRWNGGHYQDETLFLGQLIKEARDERNFSRADKMIDIIEKNSANEVYVASFIRLLVSYNSERLLQVLSKTITDNPSPLVRAAAAENIGRYIRTEIKDVLIAAISDTTRVVRVAAAASLTHFPDNMFSTVELEKRNKAFEEYKKSLNAFPDSWSSHYNLGNFHFGRRDVSNAVTSFENAIKLNKEAINAYVNLSLAYSMKGDYQNAEKNLKLALEQAPNDPVINANYGLLLGELGRMEEAKKHYLKVLEMQAENLVALYNLSIIYANTDITKTLEYAKRAYVASPNDSKYGYTYAFFLDQAKAQNKAIVVLKDVIRKNPPSKDVYLLLEKIYVSQNNKQAAVEMYKTGLSNNSLDMQLRNLFTTRLNSLK